MSATPDPRDREITSLREALAESQAISERYKDGIQAELDHLAAILECEPKWGPVGHAAEKMRAAVAVAERERDAALLGVALFAAAAETKLQRCADECSRWMQRCGLMTRRAVAAEAERDGLRERLAALADRYAADPYAYHSHIFAEEVRALLPKEGPQP